MLGLILAELSAGVRFGQQALLTKTRHTTVANQVGPVDTTLRSLIAQAWPGAAGTEARFAGTERTLSFRTVMPESLSALRTRDADVTIGVDSDHRLFLTWLPWYRNWIVPKPLSARIDLLSDVDHVEFAYWDPSLHLRWGHCVDRNVGPKAPEDPAGFHGTYRPALARHHRGDGTRCVDVLRHRSGTNPVRQRSESAA